MEARAFLHKAAEQKNDGFMSGQISWILEAMEEFAKQEIKYWQERCLAAEEFLKNPTDENLSEWHNLKR